MVQVLKPKICFECGKEFPPRSGRQMRCLECRAKLEPKREPPKPDEVAKKAAKVAKWRETFAATMAARRAKRETKATAAKTRAKPCETREEPARVLITPPPPAPALDPAARATLRQARVARIQQEINGGLLEQLVQEIAELKEWKEMHEWEHHGGMEQIAAKASRKRGAPCPQPIPDAVEIEDDEE